MDPGQVSVLPPVGVVFNATEGSAGIGIQICFTAKAIVNEIHTLFLPSVLPLHGICLVVAMACSSLAVVTVPSPAEVARRSTRSDIPCIVAHASACFISATSDSAASRSLPQTFSQSPRVLLTTLATCVFHPSSTHSRARCNWWTLRTVDGSISRSTKTYGDPATLRDVHAVLRSPARYGAPSSL
jgi:hypothetical protein